MGFLSHLLADVNPFDGPKPQQKTPMAQLPSKGQPGFGVLAPRQAQPVQQPAPTFATRFNNFANSNYNPTHLVENMVVDPIANSAIKLSTGIGNNIYNHGIAPVFNLPHNTIQQDLVNTHNPYAQNVASNIGNQTFKQQAGNALVLGASMLPAGGKLIENGAARVGGAVSSKVAPVIGDTVGNIAGKFSSKLVNYGGKAAIGLDTGYGYGAGQTMANDPNASLHDINKAGVQNAKIGATLGVAAPIVGDVAPVVAKGANKTITPIVNHVKDNQAITSQQKDLAAQIAGHQQQLNSLPITNHTAAETLQRKIDAKSTQIANLEASRPQMGVTKAINTAKTKLTPLNQGGYVGNPFFKDNEQLASNAAVPIQRSLPTESDPALTSSLANAADNLVTKAGQDTANYGTAKAGDIAQAKYGKVAQPTASSLHQEALKYKSADEFVNAQRKNVKSYYRGVPDNSSFTEMGIKPPESTSNGMYVTSKKGYAKTFAGKNGTIQNVEAEVKNPYVVDKNNMHIIEGAGTWPEKIDELKSKGYDSIAAPDGQVYVFDRSKQTNLLSKQQLTDIYNQVHGKSAPTKPSLMDKLHIKPINENGYVRIPSGAKDPAPDLHPAQKEFINEYANMLESQGSGNGVSIMPDGTRASNNFRTAENKGKAMTKQDWFDQARQDIESGKAAYGASDEYKQLPSLSKRALPPAQAKSDNLHFSDGSPANGGDIMVRDQHGKNVKFNSTDKTPLNSEYEATIAQQAAHEADGFLNYPSPYAEPLTAAQKQHLQTVIKTQNARVKGFYDRTEPTAKPTAPKQPAIQPAKKPLPGESQKSSVSSESSVAQDTTAQPKLSTADYLKQQTAAQEAARKAGNPSGLDKVKAVVAKEKTKLIDSLSPIEDTVNQKITKDNATSHITPQLDRALRSDTIAGQYIKDSGLAKVIQNVPDTKEFDQYLIAKHAADLEKNGIRTGRDSAADAQLVRDLAPKYEEHAKAIQQYSHGLLDQAVHYGLISKELAANLKAKYPNYVPVNRIFGEDELTKPPKGVGGGKASLSQQSIVQRIKGSGRTIESPLGSIVDKTHQVIDQGERNLAAQKLISYKDLPGNPFELRELKPSETVGTKPVISMLDHGKTRRFETTPEIAAAAKSLNKEQLGLVGKILNAPVRVLRLGATSLNPAFTVANVAKDMVTGFINSEHGLRSSVANPKVFLKALEASLNHGSKAYGELVREGAGGTSFDIARGKPVDNVRTIRAGKNAGTKIAYTVTHPAQLFRVAEDTIGRSEEFGRALQYFGGKDAAKAAGATDEAARVMGAHAARNNTTNFARAGDYGRVINSVIPYLNAGFQGSRTLIRNLGDRPVQTSTKLVVAAFLPVAATTAWNVSDAKRKAAYDDIKPYEKQGNIIIVPPNPVKDPNTGKWNVIKIPLSQEVANLANVVRNGVETGMHDGTFSKTQAAGDLLGTATSLNLQSPRQAVGQVLPQAAKAPIEALTNQNLYTGNKIVPDSQKNLDPRDQYGPTSSGTARTVGKALNISPRQIDNFIKTSAGGLGQNLVNVSDNVLAKTGVIQPTDVKGTSFGASFSKRFQGAQGSNQYDVIDNQTASLTQQLKKLPGYQSMSPADKAKALNRLTNTITQTYTSTKNLSQRQQDIKNNKPNLDSYLTTSTSNGPTVKVAQNLDPSYKQTLTKYGSMNTTDRTAAFNKDKGAQYAYDLADYNNKKASGKLSTAQDIASQNILAREKVGSSYDKNIRDLYNLSAADLSNYLTTDKNGQATYDQLKQLDKAYVDSGIRKTSKFKNGLTTTTKTSSGKVVSTSKSTGSSRTSTTRKSSGSSKSSNGSSPSAVASAFGSTYSSPYKFSKSLRGIAQKATMGSTSMKTKSYARAPRVKAYKAPTGLSYRHKKLA